MSMLGRMTESTAKSVEERAAQAAGTSKHAKLAARAAKLRAKADAQATLDRDSDAAKADSDAIRAYVTGHKAERLGTYSSLHAFPDRIINKPLIGAAEERPIAGVSATVAQAGQRGSRSTLTRSLVPGMHGWQKGVDDRSAWMTVDGPDFQWTVSVGTDGFSLRAARQFAAQLTGWGRQASAAETPGPSAGGGLTEQLTSLAELHTSGALTSEEYAVAKARLLGT